MFSERTVLNVDYNAACGFLNHLNAEELRGMLNDENKFEDMIKDFKQAKEIDTEKEMLLASNRSLAEYTLSRESDLKLAKQQLQELSSIIESLYKNIEDRSSKIRQRKRTRNPETLLALLQTAAVEVEDESEKIAESFLRGDSDVDQFLEQFALRRKLMHLRRVKGDKMTEMVRRRSSQKTHHIFTQNSNLPSNLPYLYQPPPPPVPYPIGPNNLMPVAAFPPYPY